MTEVHITTKQVVDMLCENPRKYIDILVALDILKHNVVEYTVEGSNERFTTEGYQINV